MRLYCLDLRLVSTFKTKIQVFSLLNLVICLLSYFLLWILLCPCFLYTSIINILCLLYFNAFSVSMWQILLLALTFWSFHFTSLCAFGLLAYVGYILYAFPSMFHLHWLNGLLLVFVLCWAASTYIFNLAFTVLNKKLWKVHSFIGCLGFIFTLIYDFIGKIFITLLQDMEIWETIGLWHYPIPGFFLFAQFGLGGFVAMCNLVNNSVFLYLSDGNGQSSNEDSSFEGEESHGW